MLFFSAIAVLILTALLYFHTFGELAQLWAKDVNNSHGWMVPLVSAIFAWRVWKQHGPPWKRCVAPRSVGLGLAGISFGLLLHAEAWFNSALLVDIVALVVILYGTVLVMGGRRTSRAYGFPILFLLFLAPWPPGWYPYLANELQWVVSAVSAEVLVFGGLPVMRDGYLLHLPGHSIEVAEACSGMRQLNFFVVMSVVVAELNGGSRWSRLALFIIALPIAVLSNCVRIVLTAVVLVVAGPRYAEDAFHSLEGTAVAAIGVAIFLGAAAGINSLDRWWKARRTAPATIGSLFNTAQPQWRGGR